MDFGYTPEQEALRREVRAFIAGHVTLEVARGDGGPQRGPDRRQPRHQPRAGGARAVQEDRRARAGWASAIPRSTAARAATASASTSSRRSSRGSNIAVATGRQRRAGDPGGGHRGAEALLHPAADQRRVLLRPGIHRAARRRRPRLPAVPRGPRRRRLRHQRPEDVHLRAPTIAPTSTSWRGPTRDVPKHKGISIFLFPMDTPGITVRPLWTIQNDPQGAHSAPPTATSRTNETFFDDVRVHEYRAAGRGERGLERRVDGAEPRPRRRRALPDLRATRRGHRQLGQGKPLRRLLAGGRSGDPGQARRALDRGPGVPAHDDAQHVHRRARRPLHLRGLGREGVGARARGQDHRGDHARCWGRTASC